MTYSRQKRVFATISLFCVLALLPISCDLICLDSCGCGPAQQVGEIRIRSWQAKTISESNQAIEKTEIRDFDKAFVGLSVDEVVFLADQSSEQESFGSLGMAYACSPIPPQTANTLSLIQLINQKEFTTAAGVTYSAGEDISSLFGIGQVYVTKLSPFAEFVGSGLRPTTEDYFRIGLLGDPGKVLELEFTVRLVFDDRQEFLLSDQFLNVN